MTKKIIFLISSIIGAGLIVVDYMGTYFWCDYFIRSGHEGSCPFFLSDAIYILFPIIPLFIFSLVTFKMQDKIFQKWWKFARIWVPLSMLAVFISPSYSHNWMFPIEKGTVSFLLSLLFVVISAISIAYETYKARKN